MQPFIYLCGPITGLSYSAARNGWRREFATMVDPSIGILSPMRQEGRLAEVRRIKNDSFDGSSMSTKRAIIAKDKLDVQRSTLMVANFRDAKIVSIGSTVEFGWADAYGKPIVLIMEPRGNLHEHSFITELASFRVKTLEEAAEVVNALLIPGV